MWRLFGQCLYQVGVRFAKSGVWLAVRRKYLQLSNVKPTQFTNGDTSKRIRTLIQPLKGRQITKPKAYRQPVSLNCDNKIMSQLLFAFTGRNRVKSMESLWIPFKKYPLKKPPAKYQYQYISVYVNNSSILGDPVPLNLWTKSLLLSNMCPLPVAG